MGVLIQIIPTFATIILILVPSKITKTAETIIVSDPSDEFSSVHNLIEFKKAWNSSILIKYPFLLIYALHQLKYFLKEKLFADFAESFQSLSDQ